MREGERSDHVVLLTQGLVKATVTLENGRIALLNVKVGASDGAATFTSHPLARSRSSVVPGNASSNPSRRRSSGSSATKDASQDRAEFQFTVISFEAQDRMSST